MFINYKKVNKLCYFPYNEVESPKRTVKKGAMYQQKRKASKLPSFNKFVNTLLR